MSPGDSSAPTSSECSPKSKSAKPERIGDCLYKRGGMILARVRVDGKATWRSTGTAVPAEARQWLKKWRTEQFLLRAGIEPQGVVLHRARVTVGEIIDVYTKAGCPTRKMQRKAERTVRNELHFLKPIRNFFGGMQAAALTLGDADKYFEWRASGGYVAVTTVHGKERTIKTTGGKRAVDLELTILSNALSLAVRRNMLKSNPLASRGRYTSAGEVRHCREVAPTVEGLRKIENWLREQGDNGTADLVCFLAFSGLRIGEALSLDWEAVDWSANVIHVRREKRGIFPWVPIAPEMTKLLQAMRGRATCHLLFPSPLNPDKPRDGSFVGRRIADACEALGLRHVTAHGLRSFFVTRCRESGLSDAEVAMLIGDKSGPALIAAVYGDVLPEHLKVQAQRVRLTAEKSETETGSTKRSTTVPKADGGQPKFAEANAVAKREVLNGAGVN